MVANKSGRYLDSASQLETGSTFQYNVMGAFCNGCHAHHPAMTVGKIQNLLYLRKLEQPTNWNCCFRSLAANEWHSSVVQSFPQVAVKNKQKNITKYFGRDHIHGALMLVQVMLVTLLPPNCVVRKLLKMEEKRNADDDP
ncbi:hypothetical protein OUZ56_015663 [Daphnia magna]|uniref:Uncharacterized protein n=1 Tax=Daphnia magna TaxID=35525 RepID=A0ABR0ANV8_9CRUS|nr:hypothetical protein OUZ56_015663 [Daphnia magna]